MNYTTSIKAIPTSFLDTPLGLACPYRIFDARLRGVETIIDVRTAEEFAKGALPRSVNLPLFSSTERAELGLLYKYSGQRSAIERGKTIAHSRLHDYFAQFELYRRQSLLVYCARGGMRSSAVVNALVNQGYAAQQLPKGYKGFRNQLRHYFQYHLPAQWIVLRGHTGCGKTALLHQLPNALDLEALAGHRGSVFGGLEILQTQQSFEARLYQALSTLDPLQPVWVEGESRWIGPVMLPAPLWQYIRESPSVWVHSSFQSRIERVISEYAYKQDLQHTSHSQAILHAALNALTAHLGKKAVGMLQQWLLEGDFQRVVAYLLLHHYDPRYTHAMAGITHRFTVCADQFDAALYALQQFGAHQSA